MCAQEEMVHSLIHNISMGFAEFSEKNTTKPKKKTETAKPNSILDNNL